MVEEAKGPIYNMLRINKCSGRTALSMVLMRVQCRNLTSTSSLLQQLQTPEEIMITKKLQDALSPKLVKVQDISGGCGSMFSINVTSDKFNTLTTVKQHKMINEILKEDIPRWHGLQLQTKKDTSK